MADTGSMTFWSKGSPMAPRSDAIPADPGGVSAGTETFWIHGSPIAPQSWHATYGYGTYGGTWATYGNLTNDFWFPARVTADYFERIVAASTNIGNDSYDLYTWAANESRLSVDGRRMRYVIDQNVSRSENILPVQIADGRVTMQWEFEQDIPNDSYHSSDSYYVSIIFRKTDSTHWYRFTFNMQAGGANAIAVQKTSNGGSTYTNIGTALITNEIVSPLPTSRLTRINMWVDYKGTSISAACWGDDHTYPGIMFDFTDSAIAGVGDVGIEFDTNSYTSGAKYTVGVNYFVVQQPLNTAPLDTGTGVDTSTLSTGTVSKSGSDSGTGADASTLHAAYSSATTGSGSDASSQHAAYPQTDTGTGADASSNVHHGTDSGTSTDVSTQQTNIQVADSGTGVDSTSSNQRFGSDTGTCADASSLHAAYTLTDTGASTDASTLSASYPQTDSGTATDTSTNVHHGTDSGSSTDVSAQQTTVDVADSGIADDEAVNERKVTDTGSTADASTLAAAYSLTDTGGSSEASTLAAAYAQTDTGTADDESTNVHHGSDSGSSTDESAQQTNVLVSDIGVAADTSQEADSFVVQETPTGDDTATVTAAISAEDTGTADDASTLSAAYDTSDSGVSSDDSTLAAAYAQEDTGTADDTSSNIHHGTDSATSTDVSSQTTTVDVADSGTATDTARSYRSSEDTASGTDDSTLAAAITVTDHGGDDDEATLHATFARSDTGTGTDASTLTTRNLIAASDSGSASDSSSLHSTYGQDESGSADDSSVNLRVGRDFGTGNSGVATLHAAYTATQTGHGVESSRLVIDGGRVLISVNDEGTDTEVAFLHAVSSAADTGTGTDASSEHAHIRAEDEIETDLGDHSVLHTHISADQTGHGRDRITRRSFQIPESGMAADSAFEHAKFAFIDTGTGTESTDSDVMFSLLEHGHGFEVISDRGIYILDLGTDYEKALSNSHPVMTVPLVVYQRGKIHVWLSGTTPDSAYYDEPLDHLEFTEPALYP